MKDTSKPKGKIVAPVQRAKGGKAMVVSGNPNVLKEARDRDTKGRFLGGSVKAKLRMAGGPVKQRADRPARRGKLSGGSVGANTSPLSTAHNTTGTAGASNPTDTYGGNP